MWFVDLYVATVCYCKCNSIGGAANIRTKVRGKFGINHTGHNAHIGVL